jgi:MFS family permease
MAGAVLLFVAPAPAQGRRRKYDEVPLIGETLRLFRLPVFHLLLWSYTICGFTTSGIIEIHLLPYAAACGFPPLESATAYGVLSAVNLGGMVLSGWLTDRMNRPLLLGSIYILRGLAFILLIWAARDISLLFVFAVLFGLFDYSTVPVTASLAASHIGLRSLGLTMGLLSAGHSLGAALGAELAGVLYDMIAQYFWVWIAALGLAILAGLLSFAIAEDRKPSLALGTAH